MLTAAFLFAIVGTSVQAQDILPQGKFDVAGVGNKPSGWDIPWGPENVTLAGDDKNRWVQIGDGAALYHMVKLPERAKTLVVSARLKLSNYEKGPQGWHRARVSMTFTNAQGAEVSEQSPVPDLTANSDWVTKEVTLNVPKNATQLRLQPGLWGSKGLFEIDDLVVKVTQIGDAEVPIVAADAPWPATAKVPAWGTEPVKVRSSKRARVSLNGAWKFSPHTGSGQANVAPEKGWGYMPVPGNWRRNGELLAKGTGPQWTDYNRTTLSAAWYERSFKIPADWDGQHISIDFERISTDATFWINGKPAGTINWPEGELDITNLVKAGEEVTLRAFVVATIEKGEVLVMMGDAPGQNWTEEKKLESGGIVRNVTLQSRPKGPFVSDVFIQPSVREKKLNVDFELSGVTQAGPVQIVASLVNENGKEEKRFTETVNATTGATQRLKVGWAWENPRLWDYKEPNLYTLRLSAKGPGLDDEPAINFGFRETWIEGRDVYLNGSKFRIRPFLLGNRMGAGHTIPEAFELGYNFGEAWPDGTEHRSSSAAETVFIELADKAGMPISAGMPHAGWMGNGINNPEKEALFPKATQRVLRRFQNNPSIIIWGTSGNMMGAYRDPAYVGMIEKSRKAEAKKGTPTSSGIPYGDLAVKNIKSSDPTRPVFIHNGGSAGDIYTLNHYLNFIPLQEREEWLSHYVVHGEMPLMYVEFGTPVNIGAGRGRNGFVKAYRSETWMTEFCAIYLGSEAYKLNRLLIARNLSSSSKRIRNMSSPTERRNGITRRTGSSFRSCSFATPGAPGARWG